MSMPTSLCFSTSTKGSFCTDWYDKFSTNFLCQETFLKNHAVCWMSFSLTWQQCTCADCTICFVLAVCGLCYHIHPFAATWSSLLEKRCCQCIVNTTDWSLCHNNVNLLPLAWTAVNKVWLCDCSVNTKGQKQHEGQRGKWSKREITCGCKKEIVCFVGASMQLSHAKQQRVTDSQQGVGIVSKVSALKINRKYILFVGPHTASS